MANPILVFIPCFGLSQFVPMLELAKRLLQITATRFSVTVIIANPAAPGKALAHPFVQSLASSGLDVRCEEIPPTAAPPAPIRTPADISSLFALSHDAIKTAIEGIQTSGPVAGVVIDLFGTSLIDVASELGVPSYIYFAATAAMLALFLHLPTLHEKFPMEFGEMTEDVKVPGIISIPPSSLPMPLMNKKGAPYKCFLDNGRRFLEAKGIIINTFSELEPAAIEAIRRNLPVPADQVVPPIYPVGPLVAAEETKSKDQCTDWLDAQPAKSVVFMCFGSMRGLDTAMVPEMAAGVEQSGQRFLWSLRSMDPSVDVATELLPEGFMERTKERGLVWPGWVSQKEVLGHPAVGGFVTHCGWNSISESLWFGVPMVGWPLYAEQHLNALLMARQMGAAVELKMAAGNMVEAKEFARGIRVLMEEMEEEEGKRVRAKVEELKIASRKAMEKGGSSYATLELLAMELVNN